MFLGLCQNKKKTVCNIKTETIIFFMLHCTLSIYTYCVFRFFLNNLVGHRKEEICYFRNLLSTKVSVSFLKLAEKSDIKSKNVVPRNYFGAGSAYFFDSLSFVNHTSETCVLTKIRVGHL